ncbi:MAG: hypothetical protein R3C53_05965 [Pirellulaceae bacterium]
MSYEQDQNNFQQALQGLEIQALNFGYRWIKDGAVRQQYVRRTSEMSKELRAAVEAGIKSPREAAEIANQMRNEIMEMARVKSSDLGRAGAKALKAKGLAFDDLVKKTADRKFSKAFEQLTKGQQDEVLIEIVESAGRANPRVSTKVARFGSAGRALWVLSIAIAVYNIGTAEDKVDATQRELVTAGGGFLGGAAGGAAAGIWFGPLGVAVGVAVGGALGALMSDRAYVQIRGQEDVTVDSIISRYTNMVSTDEAGIANALVNEAGMDMRLVSGVFAALSRDYSSDADDVARLYIERLRKNGGTARHALSLDEDLKAQLIGILDGGWTTGYENEQIRYLKSL